MSLIENFNLTHFANREQAGILLAEKLLHLSGRSPVVLAIPRGGIVVAREIALKLNAELDLIFIKKIGARGNPELAIGAVSEDGGVYRNEELIRELMISEQYIEKEISTQLKKLSEKAEIFSEYRNRPLLKNRLVIITDDGIATGATMISAINCINLQEPKSIFVALPVGPPDTIESISDMVDGMICLLTPEYFMAVGRFYEEFEQVSDSEVIKILKEFSHMKIS